MREKRRLKICKNRPILGIENINFAFSQKFTRFDLTYFYMTSHK